MHFLKLFFLLNCLFSILSITHAQDIQTPDKDRAETLLKLGTQKIPDPMLIRSKSKTIFSKPIEQQSEAELKMIAEISNHYANLVGIIHKEYADYYSENYRYEFVQKKVMPAHDAYVKLGNEFKNIRDQAYLNLGEKKAGNGQTVEAFLYYADAYRLSGFDCGKSPKKSCMRLIAEQKMKDLLGSSNINSYVSWQ